MAVRIDEYGHIIHDEGDSYNSPPSLTDRQAKTDYTNVSVSEHRRDETINLLRPQKKYSCTPSSFLNALKIIGLSVLLSVVVFWAYYFITGLIMVTILHIDGIMHVNFVLLFFPVLASLTIFMFKVQRNDREYQDTVRLNICCAIWFLSIPVAALLVLLLSFNGSWKNLSNQGDAIIILKMNAISFVITSVAALFFPIKKS